MRSPGHRFFQGAPTRAQAKAIFWKRMKKWSKPFWKEKPNETDLSITLINDAEIAVVGLDQPERIEGQPWHGCHLTEIDDMKPSAWPQNIRPVLSDTKGFAILEGVPNGKGQLYDMALYACGGAIPKTEAGVGMFVECPTDPEWCYYHWFSEDVLSPSEIESAKRSLDQKVYRQEYEGSFEGFDGLAYYGFGSENIIDNYDLDKTLEVCVGMDFNWDPMSSTIWQEDAQGNPVCHEAFKFHNCGTVEACNRIIDHCGTDVSYVIFPDAASNNRSPHGETGKSDLVLIKQAFDSRGCEFSIRVKKTNPTRKDRLNSFNAMLCNGAGERRLKVMRKARHLIHDMQRIPMEEYLNDNYTDSQLGHVSDSAAYYIDYRFPVRFWEQSGYIPGVHNA